jgi:anthranilate phosphoribosyltransferase
MAKHGNRAQTSLSGSADLLAAIAPNPPAIFSINNTNILSLYNNTNYAFLFAPNFHPGMKHATPIRRELGLRTIFNLLGPLANPVEHSIEARLVGVAYQSLGPVFARAIQLSGAKKAMIVCGLEDLDEISCAGKTNCWRLTERPNPEYRGSQENGDYETSDDEAPPRMLTSLEHFQLQPSDFGLPSHPLSEVYSGKLPRENAVLLMKLLRNELKPDDPILDFVLINTGALLVVSGICDSDTSSIGDGDDGNVITERGPGGGRWKEGVRRARWCIESGAALRELEKFSEVTRGFKMDGI